LTSKNSGRVPAKGTRPFFIYPGEREEEIVMDEGRFSWPQGGELFDLDFPVVGFRYSPCFSGSKPGPFEERESVKSEIVPHWWRY